MRNTGGHVVRPLVLAAGATRDDVVEGQIGRVEFLAAILAAESVAQQDRAPAEFWGAVDRRIVTERDYLYHPAFPLRPARALRTTLFAETRNLETPFALAVFRAYWTDSQDISDLAVLRSLAAAVGLDAGEIAAAAEDPIWKQRLAANTEEAAGKGIFGVPTVDAGGKLYVGNDRLEMLERYLG